MTAEQDGAAPGTVVGFVGLGNMGIPMTKRLVAAGYQVRGFDTAEAARHAFAALHPGSATLHPGPATLHPGSNAQKASIEAGESANEPGTAGNASEPGTAGNASEPGTAGNASEPGTAGNASVPGTGGGVTAVAELGSVGDGADAVILMLPDSDIVERVVLGRLASEPPRADGPNGGLLASLAAGATIIDMSSSDPARTRVLAEQVAAAGVTLIDAPVSGGVAGARAGTLMVMVGGPAEAFERFKPMLGAIGKRVVHAGDIGAGHAVKALNNLMSAAHLLASSEALIAGRRFGLDPAVMLEIVNGASGRSGSTENKWPNYVLTERYDAGFSVRLMVKDLNLALSIEHATGVPAAASEAVVATWEAALADLPPDADHTSIAQWLAGRSEP